MDYFSLNLPTEYLNQVPNLSLAHVGDAVFELMVRAMLAASIKESVQSQHKKTVKLVAAPAQARAAEIIIPVLTEEELKVFNRGRNTKVNSVPHAATVKEYHEATALETLFGYLYLCGRKDRLSELFGMMMEE